MVEVSKAPMRRAAPVPRGLPRLRAGALLFLIQVVIRIIDPEGKR